MCSDKSDAENLLVALNQADSRIKFEMEYPKYDGSIALLDFKVSLAGNSPHFEFYQKNAGSDVFVNYKSALPLAQKISIIRNEKDRIVQRCTSPQDAHSHLDEFER